MPMSHFHSTWRVSLENFHFFRVTDRFVKRPTCSFFSPHQQLSTLFGCAVCESITVCPTLLFTRHNRVTHSA